MLLLGAGESGKSTIFKQMKVSRPSRWSWLDRCLGLTRALPARPASAQVINKEGYSETERREFKGVVHMNVCQVRAQ